MFTRQYISSFHCRGCDRLLNDHEIDMDKEFDSLCEECYGEAMNSAYEDKDLE